MSRKPAAAATALLLAAVMAAPAEAGLFKRGKKAEAPAAAAADKTKPAAEAARQKANAEERAAAQRLDPLARVAFWSREFSIDMQDAEAGVALSSALRSLGRHEEAAETAKRVLTLKPNHVEALLETARAHIARNQGFYAIEPAKKAQAAAPRDWRAVSLLGVAYEQTGRGPEARQAWEAALKLSPDNASVLANLGLSYAAAGDLKAAEGYLRRASAQPGATVKVRQNLVMVLGLQGKLQEAERLAREDLPPEVVTANLAWLRSAGPSSGRSWDAMKSGGGTAN
jgi:Flp pilus assembly protein TadD